MMTVVEPIHAYCLLSLRTGSLFWLRPPFRTLALPAPAAPAGLINSRLLLPPLSLDLSAGELLTQSRATLSQAMFPPFAAAVLLRCEEVGCFELNSAQVDSEGRFRLSTDSTSQPLEVGTYQVLAFADQYQQGQTNPFEVGEGEDRDVGDIPCNHSLFSFPKIHPCEDLSLQGGICSYSVRVSRTARPRSSMARSGPSLRLGESDPVSTSPSFKTANPRKVKLSSMASNVVRFDFAVPDTVRDGAFICADVFIGEDRARALLQHNRGQEFVLHHERFCLASRWWPESGPKVSPTVRCAILDTTEINRKI